MKEATKKKNKHKSKVTSFLTLLCHLIPDSCLSLTKSRCLCSILDFVDVAKSTSPILSARVRSFQSRRDSYSSCVMIGATFFLMIGMVLVSTKISSCPVAVHFAFIVPFHSPEMVRKFFLLGELTSHEILCFFPP